MMRLPLKIGNTLKYLQRTVRGSWTNIISFQILCLHISLPWHLILVKNSYSSRENGLISRRGSEMPKRPSNTNRRRAGKAGIQCRWHRDHLLKLLLSSISLFERDLLMILINSCILLASTPTRQHLNWTNTRII